MKCQQIEKLKLNLISFVSSSIFFLRSLPWFSILPSRSFFSSLMTSFKSSAKCFSFCNEIQPSLWRETHRLTHRSQIWLRSNLWWAVIINRVLIIFLLMLIIFQFFFLQLSDEEDFKSASAKGWAYQCNDWQLTSLWKKPLDRFFHSGWLS